MSQIGIKLTTGALFGGNEPINPLMADRPAWLLLLQPLGDLLRTHAMLEPHREMMAEPCRRLAKLARTRSTSITFMGRRNSLVDILGAVAANLATDRRGMHADPLCNARLALCGAQARSEEHTSEPSHQCASRMPSSA